MDCLNNTYRDSNRKQKDVGQGVPNWPEDCRTLEQELDCRRKELLDILAVCWREDIGKNSSYITEWLNLIQLRDEHLRSTLYQENQEIFNMCLLRLKSCLCDLLEFKDSHCSDEMARSASTLYWQIAECCTLNKLNDNKNESVVATNSTCAGQQVDSQAAASVSSVSLGCDFEQITKGATDSGNQTLTVTVEMASQTDCESVNETLCNTTIGLDSASQMDSVFDLGGLTWSRLTSGDSLFDRGALVQSKSAISAAIPTPPPPPPSALLSKAKISSNRENEPPRSASTPKKTRCFIDLPAITPRHNTFARIMDSNLQSSIREGRISLRPVPVKKSPGGTPAKKKRAASLGDAESLLSSALHAKFQNTRSPLVEANKSEDNLEKSKDSSFEVSID